MMNTLREFVKNCSPEEKDAVMGELLKEARSLHPDSHLIPLADSDGVEVGYFVSNESVKQYAEHAWNELSPELRATLGRPVSDLEDTLSPEELKAQLRKVSLKRC